MGRQEDGGGGGGRGLGGRPADQNCDIALELNFPGEWWGREVCVWVCVGGGGGGWRGGVRGGGGSDVPVTRLPHLEGEEEGEARF